MTVVNPAVIDGMLGQRTPDPGVAAGGATMVAPRPLANPRDAETAATMRGYFRDVDNQNRAAEIHSRMNDQQYDAMGRYFNLVADRERRRRVTELLAGSPAPATPAVGGP